MKKKILIILLILIMPLCLLSGCIPKIEDYTTVGQNRFIAVKVYKHFDEGSTIYIMVDKETKIMYMLISGIYRCGITALLDENGNPQKYEGEL